ncbi:MAG: NAD(P)-dependent oxidoreductase [Chromatiales bacterium]|nr:NAD(P)-dependent oxidoreductase [Chromatiales bacterium]
MVQRKPVIGFIGIGLMGRPMSTRLVQAGYEVWVWNRSAEKLSPVLDAGAKAAGSIAELVTHADIVMTCLINTDAVRSIVLGEAGISESGSTEKLLVDFSSIAPDATREMAAELKRRCGMGWVDAPVSGGVAGAESGTLAIMAGGDREDVEALRPILEHLSQRVTHMGEVGSGQVTKICNQMLVSCNVLVMAEAFALAEKAGVNLEQIPAALAGGFADSIPLQLTGPRMARGEFDEVKWHVNTLLKDLDMAGDLATAMGSAVPMAGLGVELMRMYATRGYGGKDPANLIRCYRDEDNID